MLRTSFLAVVGLIALKLVFGVFSLLWWVVSIVVPVLVFGGLIYAAYRLLSTETVREA